jgi:hypothetical protein
MGEGGGKEEVGGLWIWGKQDRGPYSELDGPLSKLSAILTTEIISDMD